MNSTLFSGSTARSDLRRTLPPLLVGFSLLLFLMVSAVAIAQTEGGSRPTAAQEARAKARAAKLDAYESFKHGDIAGGLAKITAGLDRTARARDLDFQTGVQLAIIAMRLQNESEHVRAAELAAISLQHFGIAQSRIPIIDRANAHALAGRLYEHVLGDPAQARAAYRQVLALDPTQKLIAERLEYLAAVEAFAAEKTSANESLQQRAAGAPQR